MVFRSTSTSLFTRVIAGSQTVHLHVEPGHTRTHSVQQYRVALGVIDSELMDRVGRALRRFNP